MAIGSLLFVIIGIPLIVAQLVPQVIDTVRDLFEQPGLVGRATFVTVVGTLGVMPYLFFKAVESMPTSLRCIWDEFRNICRDQWLPGTRIESDILHVVAIATRRIAGLGKTIWVSISLIMSLAVIASTVAWATMSPENGAQAVVRIDGRIITDTTTEGIEIDIRCEDNNGTTMSTSESIIVRDPSRNTHRVSLECQYAGGGGPRTLDQIAASLESLRTEVNTLITSIQSRPSVDDLMGEFGNIRNEIDEHLNRHLDFIDARIDQVDEDWQERIEETSP